MLDRIRQVRQNWIDKKLKVDYGTHYYEDIFEPYDANGNRASVGKHRAFVDPNRLPGPGQLYEDTIDSDGPAWDRMVRKWTIKILQLQLSMLQMPSNETNTTDTFGKFVWATGGHSSSAAHGNFYRESYTAVLGRDLQPALKEIGLNFEVRNYAMVRCSLLPRV